MECKTVQKVKELKVGFCVACGDEDVRKGLFGKVL